MRLGIVTVNPHILLICSNQPHLSSGIIQGHMSNNKLAEADQERPDLRDTGNLTVALIQMSCGSDTEENLEKAVQRIQQAAEQGARIICLQELFRSTYFCQSQDVSCFDLAEPIPGPSSHRLAATAKQLGVVILAPLFEKRTAGIYHNTTAIIGIGGEIVGRYRKMHIPDDPHYYEKFYFTPGDLGFQSHPTAYGRLGVLICWDQWFPEAARLTTLKGAHFLFCPTAIGCFDDEPLDARKAQHDAWETVQRGHAVANGVFLAAVNRVGAEGRIDFWGQSFVSDPLGRIIVRASPHEEEVMLAHCDLSLVESTRRTWPFLRDRRIDAYEGLDARFID